MEEKLNYKELSTTEGQKFIFEKIDLKFNDEHFNNIFSLKNNKTVKETIEHRRYIKLQDLVNENYKEFLDVPLGKFLLFLKNKNDDNYKFFLNKYGDLEYSIFWINNPKILLKNVHLFRTNPFALLHMIFLCHQTRNPEVNRFSYLVSPSRY